MATHDEETRRFFKHSSVQVLLCPRIAGKRHSWAKQKEVERIYTHHQKTVIVDADAGNGKRKIVAFVGGLDLSYGRYNDPHHPLFRSLQTLHKDDYHNPTFTLKETIEYACFWNADIPLIDSNSVMGFPKEPKDASSVNLVCGKNVLIDMSIHTAYIKTIRAAQHYIYIETAFFIGSSYNWSQYKDLGANNLIPMEIALKIAAKIRENERFAVYIVIPMWPEGVPTCGACQRILFWQAIDMYENVSVSGTPPPANSPQENSRNNRRFMIYVNSKGMIVDDEYVILGSANINQHSMEGTRDTEIAMGAYQPHHTWARLSAYPHGQIHGYRMSLWAEHTGTIEDCFLQPESLECVRRIRTMGEENWKQYSASDVTEMRGHLLKYPVEVDEKGNVRSLPGHEEFPDVGGKIIGSFLAIQENMTI
ncbi:hypothetical protein ACSQ67_021127 [Phaseolus vulgaris]